MEQNIYNRVIKNDVSEEQFWHEEKKQSNTKCVLHNRFSKKKNAGKLIYILYCNITIYNIICIYSLPYFLYMWKHICKYICICVLHTHTK